MALTKTNLANIVEGILPVANGGTGTSTGPAAGGSTTQVQYNNAGAFAGSANLVWDNTNAYLGIGTASPAAKLDVNGNVFVRSSNNLYTNGIYAYDSDVNISTNSSGSQVIKLSTGAGAGTERMRIDSSGNVLIGTTSNTGKLAIALTGGHVFNTELNSTTLGSSNGALISNYYNSTTRLSAINFAADSVSAGSLIFGTASSSTLTEKMRITSGGQVLIGQTVTPSSGTSLTVQGVQYNYSTSGGGLIQTPNGTGLSFYTYTGAMGSETYTERMRITSAGYVGIGTSSPPQLFSVHGASDPAINVRNTSGSIDANFYCTTTNAVIGTSGSGSLLLHTGNTTRFQIGSAGQLGIGGATYGTSGQVLTSGGASAAPTWSAITLPAGSIRQVVNGTISTTQSTSSASAQNSGLTASITPASTSNKVFITISSVCGQNYSGRSEFLYVYKNGAQVFKYELFLNTVSTIPLTITYLDSPATTSSTSYALWYSADGLGPAFVSGGNTVSSITLMEVVG
jgi:hypothetical protein